MRVWTETLHCSYPKKKVLHLIYLAGHCTYAKSFWKNTTENLDILGASPKDEDYPIQEIYNSLACIHMSSQPLCLLYFVPDKLKPGGLLVSLAFFDTTIQ